MDDTAMTQRDEVEHLWSLCFDDGPAFRELYFTHRYRDDNTLCLRREGQVVAAMQLLPYPLAYCGDTVPTAYVSGACTHPDHRRRGLMSQLLIEAFATMRRQGAELSTLIPAQPDLFPYYARLGYATAFVRGGRRVYLRPELTDPASGPLLPRGCSAEHADMAEADVAEYLWHAMSQRPCCVLHTQDDLAVVMADLRLAGGYALVARQEGRVCGVVVAFPERPSNGPTSPIRRRYIVEEIVADTTDLRIGLLRTMARHTGATHLILRDRPDGPGFWHPLGMARIIDAPAVLSRYARAHPQATLSLHLTDPYLPNNTATYDIRGGTCAIAQQRGGQQEVSPAQLAQMVLGQEGRMTMMMD